jgi:hypothetical protein
MSRVAPLRRCFWTFTEYGKKGNRKSSTRQSKILAWVDINGTYSPFVAWVGWLTSANLQSFSDMLELTTEAYGCKVLP